MVTSGITSKIPSGIQIGKLPSLARILCRTSDVPTLANSASIPPGSWMFRRTTALTDDVLQALQLQELQPNPGNDVQTLLRKKIAVHSTQWTVLTAIDFRLTNQVLFSLKPGILSCKILHLAVPDRNP